MKITIYKCEICGSERRKDDKEYPWYDNYNGGVMSISFDGINGNLHYENLCPTCRKVLRNAFEKALKELKQKQEVKNAV